MVNSGERKTKAFYYNFEFNKVESLIIEGDNPVNSL